MVSAWIAVAGNGMCHTPHDHVHAMGISPDFAEDGIIFASVRHRNLMFLRSEDCGETFLSTRAGRRNGFIEEVVFSPSFGSDGTVYIATISGLYKSTDRGMEWKPCGAMGAREYHVLSAHVTEQGLVYASILGYGVYVSEDIGETWSLFNVPKAGSDITFFEEAGNKLFLGADDSFVLELNQHTGRWRTFWADGTNIVSGLEAIPGAWNNTKLFAATWGGGVRRSLDGGTTWESCTNGLRDLYAADIALSPDFGDDSAVAICCRDGSVWISHDAGDSWIERSNGLSRKSDQSRHSHTVSIGFSPSYRTDNTLFVAKYEGLYRSTDSGGFWRHLDLIPQYWARRVRVSPSYADDHTVICGTYTAGLQVSGDAGESWAIRNTGLSGWTTAMAVSPAFGDGNRDIFLSCGVTFYDSADAGTTWNQIFDWRRRPDNGIPVRGIHVSPDFDSDGIIFMTRPARVDWLAQQGIRLKDNVVRYNAHDKKLRGIRVGNRPKRVNDVVFTSGPGHRTRLLAATGDGIYSSLNDGLSWRRVALKGQRVMTMLASPDYDSDNTLFAAVDICEGRSELPAGALFRSRDSGRNWTRLAGGLDAMEVENFALSPSYGTDQTIYVVSHNEGLLKSHNDGASWQKAGLRGRFILDLVFSPDYEKDRTLFAGSLDGLYRTTTDGDCWEMVSGLWRGEEDHCSVSYRGAGGMSVNGPGYPHFNEEAGWARILHAEASGGSYAKTFSISESASFFFTGTSVTCVGVKGPDMGIAWLSLDGHDPVPVDLYSETVQFQQELYSSGQLDDGPHVLHIGMSGSKAEASSGLGLAIDAFDVERAGLEK